MFVRLLVFLCLLLAPVWAQTPRGEDHTVHHGLRVEDPYRWLEKAETPEVKAWIEGQNERVERHLSRFAGRQKLVDRIKELSLTSASQFSPYLAGQKLFFMRQVPPQPQPVLVSQDWPQGQPKVLVDTNKQEHPSAITDFWPSPNGRYVAYGTADGGSELTTIYFVEVATGQKLKDRLPHAGGGTTPPALVWDSDEGGVTYVRLPLPDKTRSEEQLFNASLYHHRLGASAGQDRPAFGQGLSRVAEWELSSSKGGQHAAALVHFGDGAPYRVYMRGPGGWKLALGPEADLRAGGAWLGQRLLVVSFQDAPRGKVLALSADGSVETLLPQGQWSIQTVQPLGQDLLVTRVWGPDQRVEHWSGGKLVRVVGLERKGVSVGSIASSGASRVALITYGGWTLPTRWVSYDGDTGGLKTVFEVKAPGDYSTVEMERLEAVSKDGTRVPVTVLHARGVKPDSSRPTILYGYGGFGVVNGPRFLGSTLAWLEHGGVYAVANLRGGGEFGEPWHQGGMKTEKQNVFDDFYAAAQALEEAGWTRPEKLGIMGGSNGGLLVGASMIQHPQAFRAVVGLVGIYDSLRHEIWANGQYNIPEYGSFKVAEQFKAIHAYSPIHNVQKGEKYPALLLQTGENDLRVAPWQSRKFAAHLQEANASDYPILVLTQTNAGHGQGASFSQKVGKTALALTFLAQELGLEL